MTATALSAMALLCFVAAGICVMVSLRDCEFLNVLTDDNYTTSAPPNTWWLLAALGFLVAFVVIGVGALFKSGLA